MRKELLVTVCVLSLGVAPLAPAHARGDGFGAGLLGGVIGGVIGGSLAQPPPPVYVAPPPVIYERRVYVNPPPARVSAPAPHLSFHPWPGPGFACYEPEQNSVNRAICGSEDLSASSLGVQQAFYAAMQQTPYNATALRAELARFQQSERSACGQYVQQQQVDCLAGMLSQEHDVVAGRLTGAFADEAARPVGVHVAVQQRLHAMGLLPGNADGVYNDSTRRAIATWQSGQGRTATGVLTNEEVGILMPGYSSPPPVIAPPPAVVASTPMMKVFEGKGPAPVDDPPAAPVSNVSADPMGGIRENMPYGLARTKLFAAGWQTQFFSNASLSDQDREARQWFIDHHVSEVEDCSPSGCKMQFHNADGRLLYVYTSMGSHDSGAYRGAGPSVIGFCADVDDISCPTPAAAAAGDPDNKRAAK